MIKFKPIRLSEAAVVVGATLRCVGDDITLTGFASLAAAASFDLVYVDNKKYLALLNATQAGAVLISPELYTENSGIPGLLVENPREAFARLMHFCSVVDEPRGVHSSANIHPDVNMGRGVSVAENVVIGAGCCIGENAIVEAGCVLLSDVSIGDNTRLFPNVVVYADVSIGRDCIIHSGAVIGSDGFGNVLTAEGWLKVPQIGGVRVGDRVEIGANTTIDCGTLGNTIIHDGVKLDNQIQIGHNVVIGKHTAIAGKVGIAGSTVIGSRCLIGGGVMIKDNLIIVDGVVITGASVVLKSIGKEGIYSSGMSVEKNQVWRRSVVYYKRLGEMWHKIKQMEQSTKYENEIN